MRADVFLFTHGFAKSRSHACSLIKDGVFVFGEKIPKPSFLIPDDTPTDAIKAESKMPFVSRGGLKLEAAIEAFHISAKDLCVLDIGASTGGFTDCLLKNGAAFVYALDVGHGQLDASLLSDPRVKSLEGCNARYMKPSLFERQPDMAVTDVSFISQKLIYEALSAILPGGALFISLIKPQFEAGRENIGKNGIVRDARIHENVIREIRACAAAYRLGMADIVPSPIKGGDGNREYLALFVKDKDIAVTDARISAAVASAFSETDMKG